MLGRRGLALAARPPPGRFVSNLSAAFAEIAGRRRTVRSFDPARAVPREVLRDCLRLAQSAPSSLNAQPYRIVAVTDADVRRRLSAAFVGEANRRRVEAAPATVVFCADLGARRAAPRDGHPVRCCRVITGARV